MTDPLRFAVIGDPIGRSKSPMMHAAAYAALGLPHVFEALPTRLDELAARVAAVRDGTYAGMNVTIPYKRAVLAHVDVVHESARGIEAANTLLRDGAGAVVALNTDVGGLHGELLRLAPERAASWDRQDALVIGAGGAAAAAALACASIGVRRIVVRARSPEKARALAEGVRRAGYDVDLAVEPLVATALDARFGTVVQATSAGMHGADDGEVVARAVAWPALPSDAIALDVVYVPPETPFLAVARRRGLRADNGLGMLVAQGALAFEAWLGRPAPIDAMRAAVERGTTT